MKSWIRILSLFILVIKGAEASCQFKDEISQVYSLSGPVTVALAETKLLQDPKLKGISVFHPVAVSDFKGKILPGGVFLSREMALEMKGSLVFFDESRDLSRMLAGMDVKAREFKSRGILPLEVMDKVVLELREVTRNCDTELKNLLEKSRKVSSEILKALPVKFTAVFFLGTIRNGNPPEMAMVNDGAVKWLRQEGKLTTYPSELAYVSWSSKVMREMPGETLKVGLTDSGNKLIKESKRGGKRELNITYPGILIPGLSQLEGWLFLLKSL